MKLHSASMRRTLLQIDGFDRSYPHPAECATFLTENHHADIAETKLR